MMGCSTIRRQSADSIGHGHHELSSPRPASAFEDFFDVELPSSRPVSEAYMSGNSTPAGAMGARPPSLTDILLDVASPPWTLSAFMAYLSQNHCMESLEFTLDSQRYTAFYNELIMDNSDRSRDSDDRVCSLWEKLMQVYIISCAPREVNLPASVRDHLLSLPCGPTPPHPSQLDEAGRIIYELMNDSLLVPFIQSVSPLHLDSHDDHIRSPRFASHSKMGPIRSTTSMQTLESESLTDDSECNSPPAMEPMTPPTTPPTSEWSFNTHHGGFHRAVVAHNKGWKKVGAKLGFKSKTSSGRRSTPTSGDVDIDMHDSL